MAARSRYPRILRSTILLCSLALFSCGRARDSVQHGTLRYNISDIFATDAKSLSLSRAAGSGRTDEIKRLVLDGAAVNAVGMEEITPLWWALWADNFDGFEALLRLGANPNAPRRMGLPIMHLAANNPDSRFLQAALRFGGNPDEIDVAAQTTLLYRPIRGGLDRNVEILLAAGANVNAVEPYSGRILPMIAITANTNFRLAYQLVVRGADVNKKTTNGETLADIVASVKPIPGTEQEMWKAKILDYFKTQGSSL